MADYVELNLPALLNVPPKALPIITDFDKYDYILLVGGRGSAKTQTIGRILLYIGQENEVRVVCGREIQDTLEESVHQVLADLIEDWNLDWTVKKKYISHPLSGSRITFKGFREQGRVKIKGLEGVDIVWIDEAESITKPTLDIILPTIRKNNSKVIFTMNRHLVSDAVYNEMIKRDNCLVIEMNYVDNPHCPLKIKDEAELMKNRKYKDFLHIYMGQPLATSADLLFNMEKLYEAIDLEPDGENFPKRQRILAIDWAAQGDDLCVASVLDRVTNQHWKLTERIPWDDADPMSSIGRIVDLIGKFKPNVTVLDIGGQGFVVASRLKELGQDIHWFDGSTTVGVDTTKYINLRAQTYYELNDMIDMGQIIIQDKDRVVISQAEKLKMKYQSSGKRGIQPKHEMKADGNESPDDLDSVMIGVYGMRYIGESATSHNSRAAHVVRRSGSKRGRR